MPYTQPQVVLEGEGDYKWMGTFATPRPAEVVSKHDGTAAPKILRHAKNWMEAKVSGKVGIKVLCFHTKSISSLPFHEEMVSLYLKKLPDDMGSLQCLVKLKANGSASKGSHWNNTARVFNHCQSFHQVFKIYGPMSAIPGNFGALVWLSTIVDLFGALVETRATL
ncbi:hypothetical protein CK203_047639 [Vitis vinifera]|uniref:Uncharacterized protein n=1 Tax=Vitis vinifera TaxID=29760 RepID=A0A438H5V3_VITVI|nr:hypothetical protein CK203_047639 [Vitis vinifera]